MRPDLVIFLKSALRPFDYRTHDCCRWVDRWCMSLGYSSAINTLGLRYDSERSALVTIRRGGGLAALWALGMDMIGVPEADDARAGDVGVIERPTHDGLNETMGIFTGDRWASVSDQEMHFGPADVLGLWRP